MSHFIDSDRDSRDDRDADMGEWVHRSARKFLDILDGAGVRDIYTWLPLTQKQVVMACIARARRDTELVVEAWDQGEPGRELAERLEQVILKYQESLELFTEDLA